MATLGACGRYGFNALPGDASHGDDLHDVAGPPGDTPRDTPVALCPASYTIAGDDGTRFRIDPMRSTWDVAEAACEADAADGHLVTFHELEETTRVAAAAGNGAFWVGVSDRITEGTFLFVTGTAATYLPWQAGAPTAGGPDCVSWTPTAQTYLDEDCTLVRPHVCVCGDGRRADHGAF